MGKDLRDNLGVINAGNDLQRIICGKRRIISAVILGQMLTGKPELVKSSHLDHSDQ